MKKGVGFKKICKSDTYKYVYKVMNTSGEFLWYAKMKYGGCHKTEVAAARKIDLLLITAGKEPVNVLKRVKK